MKDYKEENTIDNSFIKNEGKQETEIDKILASPNLNPKEKINKIKEIDKILTSFKSFELPKTSKISSKTKKKSTPLRRKKSKKEIFYGPFKYSMTIEK